MDGLINGWSENRQIVLMDRLMDGLIDRDGWTGRWVDKKIDWWMGRWMDRLMDKGSKKQRKLGCNVKVCRIATDLFIF